MNTSSIAWNLSNFIFEINFKKIPKPVIEKAKSCLLDTIGVIIAGYNSPIAKALLSLTTEFNGIPESTIIIEGSKVPSPNAALVNGTLGHFYELDDGNRYALGHPGITTVPSAISIAERIEANVSPVEGSAEGVIVVDASIPYLGIGVLTEPVWIKVEKGFIKEIEGGNQAQTLKRDLESKNDPNVYNIAELGVGLNPKSQMTGIMLDDEGVLGTCHIGIGTSLALGGVLKAAVYYDLVLWKPTIELDGKVVIKKGEINFSI